MAGPSKHVDPLRITGFVLLTTGWILVLSAIVLLRQEAARAGFVFAGMAVELLGLVLVVRSHIALRPERN